MENRKAHRVVFERGYAANMMAIDGTWRRPCTMVDVSETGAKLTVDGSIEGLNLKEFFLLLSTMGKAYRRCQLAWVNGDQVGVFFLKPGDKKKKPKRPSGISRRRRCLIRTPTPRELRSAFNNRHHDRHILGA